MCSYGYGTFRNACSDCLVAVDATVVTDVRVVTVATVGGDRVFRVAFWLVRDVFERTSSMWCSPSLLI